MSFAVLCGFLCLLRLAWCSSPQVTELPIPTSVALSYADGRPGTAHNQHRIVSELAIDHLNEDNVGRPYRFSWKPICDTRQLLLRGYECAVELNDYSPVGIAGPFRSSIALHMVVIATQHRLLQCSPSASSPDLSEDQYPYFFRVIAADDARADTVIALLEYFRWWRAAVVHSTDRFAAGLAEKIALAALSAKVDRNRSQSEVVDLSFHTIQANFYLMAEDLQQSLRDNMVLSIRRSQVRIISVILLQGDIGAMLRWAWDAGFMAEDFAWIGMDSLSNFKQDDYLEQMDSGRLPPRDKYRNFLVITSRIERTNRTARVIASAMEKFNATVDSDFSFMLYDCIIAIGKAVETLLLQNPSLSPSNLVGKRDEDVANQLRDTAFSLEFEGATGWVQFVKPGLAGAGDRLAVFSISQWDVAGSFDEVAVHNPAKSSSILFLRPVNFSGAKELNHSSSGCEAGTEFNAIRSVQEKRDVCDPCPGGKHKKQQSRSDCSICPAGFMCGDGDGVKGTTEPEGCPAGQFSEIGALECTNCTPGRHSALPASSQCAECPGGFFQNFSGATLCEPCQLGSFQPEGGSRYCQRCPDTQGTKDPGTRSRESCGCPVGFRWALDKGNGECVECWPNLLNCSRFNSTALVMKGYYLEEDAPRNLEHIELFQCSQRDWCPGEERLGDSMCAEAREGLNCGLCSRGFYQVWGSCHECTVHHTLLYVLGSVALFLASGLMLHLWNKREEEVEVSEGLFLSITVGTALAVVQRLGVIGLVDVAWPQAVKDVLGLASGFFSSFVILTPSCALPPTLLSMYLARLCAPLLFVLSCLLWWGLSQLLHRCPLKRFPAFTVFHVVNTAGLFISALYIYAAMSTFSLVDCYQNPNGKRTIREFPFALCSGPAFESALPLFALGVLIYIIGIAGATLYALWVAPDRYRRGSGFRVMIRFLVYKFRPDKYWYGLVMMSMSFLMALVTVIFPDSTFMQLLCMKTVTASQLFVHSLNMPYTQSYANIVEAVEYLGLLILLSLGSYFFQEELANEVKDNLSRCILGIFILMGALVLCAFCWGLYLALLPHRAAGRRQAELDAQVDCILAGCEEILGDPKRFRQLLSQGTSYVERQRAVKLMQFFHDALGTPKETLKRTATTRRLFVSLVTASFRISTFSLSSVSHGLERVKSLGSSTPSWYDGSQSLGESRSIQGLEGDGQDSPQQGPTLEQGKIDGSLLVPSEIVEIIL